VAELDPVIDQIRQIAAKYPITKLVLFGSRARGDHSPVSDYDLAVFGPGLSVYAKAGFSLDVEEIATLKKIDLVFADENATDETDDLMRNIVTEGKVIYEQTTG
jgi:predicted nucleotidyltransferase